MNPVLKIDKEFKSLIRPLSRREYLQLEENILREGCRDAIITWEGIIIDGHNRYEICNKHGIEFKVKELIFDNRAEVIIWICKNQLGRRNITEETRKFLIGLQYQTEKSLTKNNNPNGKNQYTRQVSEQKPQSANQKAKEIAAENNIDRSTIEKYSAYTQALEQIGQKNPEMRTKILSGKYKVSCANVLQMANMSKEDIMDIDKKLQQVKQPYVKYSICRAIINGNEITDEDESEPQILQNIKTMPAFDPDASLTELRLTIPSWISSIQRAMNNTDFTLSTKGAQKHLTEVLVKLMNKADELLNLMEENYDSTN